MIMISFKNSRDKEHLLEKARKMEEYASMIVDCIEKSESEEEFNERSYRNDFRDDEYGRYDYKRRSR